MSLKNPVTPPGIDPGTIRLVAQRFNHYATPGPDDVEYTWARPTRCKLILNNLFHYDKSHTNHIIICISIFAGHYTTCCKKPQSCAPEYGQKFARNMLSWSWRSIKLLLLHLVGFYITLPIISLNLSSTCFKQVIVHHQEVCTNSLQYFSVHLMRRLLTYTIDWLFVQTRRG